MYSDSALLVDEKLLEALKHDFELVDSAHWFELYRSRRDGSLWRLDEWDRYQERFLIRVPSHIGWTEFDARQLLEGFLEKHRGVSAERCSMKDCQRPALNKLAYCSKHAYEIGIRK